MGHAWYRVYDDFAGDDENDMDQPCTYASKGEHTKWNKAGGSKGKRTFCIDPVGVYVEVGAAVEDIFDRVVLELLYLY